MLQALFFCFARDSAGAAANGRNEATAEEVTQSGGSRCPQQGCRFGYELISEERDAWSASRAITDIKRRSANVP